LFFYRFLTLERKEKSEESGTTGPVPERTAKDLREGTSLSMSCEGSQHEK